MLCQCEKGSERQGMNTRQDFAIILRYWIYKQATWSSTV